MNQVKSLPYSVLVENTAEVSKEIELFNAANFLNNPTKKWLPDGSLQSEDDSVIVRSDWSTVNYREMVYGSMSGWEIGHIELFIKKSSVDLDTITGISMRIVSKDARGVVVTIPIRVKKDKDQHQNNIMAKDITFRMDVMTGIFIMMPPQTEIALMLYPIPEKMPRISIWVRFKRWVLSFFKRRRRFVLPS